MIRALFLIPLLFLLNSCIEGEEEIWINADASGKFVAHYEFPAAAASKMGPPAAYRRELRRIDEEEDSITINELEFGFLKAKLVIHLELEFDNALELFEISQRQGEKFAGETGMPPSELETFLGGIDVQRAGVAVDYSREMNFGPMFPGIVKDNPGVLDDSTFRYIIHLPTSVKESNAHDISNEGKTLEWSFLLKNYTVEPIEMTFRTNSLVPWWAWVVTAVFAILLYLGIGFILKKFFRGRSPIVD